MSDGLPKHLSEEQARLLWHRAAELQADAALRLEERSRELVPSDSGSDDSGAGFELTHVRSAAVEAGISPEFVDRALAEMAVTGDSGDQKKPGPLVRAFLGKIPDSVEVSRVIRASAEEVYEAMQRIFPETPYSLELVDTQGADPLKGAVLVFGVPKFAMGVESGGFAYEMAHGGFESLYVTLHPLSLDPPSCELTVRAPLGRTRNTAFGVGVSLVGGLGLFAGVVTMATTAPLVGAAAAVGLAGLGFGGMGSLGTWGYRWAYRWGIRRSKRAVDGLLGAISSDIQTDGAFSRRGRWIGATPGDDMPALESGDKKTGAD